MERYETREALMQGLADLVALELSEAVRSRGKASLAVPGGTTPSPFLRALSQKEIDWQNIAVMLGDERFVPETSTRSNTKLLKETLLQNHASKAKLISMLPEGQEPEDGIDALIEDLEPYLPLDVIVTGMGEDMHTASLFPDSPDLPKALDPNAPSLTVIRAENAGEPRITMTAPVLKSARHKHVLLAGNNKLAPLKQAKVATTEREAPIRVMISGENPATIHYAD